MADPVELIPIRRSEVTVGKPLRRSIFDQQGNLLLAAGRVVENESQLTGLVQMGYFQDRRNVEAAPPVSHAKVARNSIGADSEFVAAPSKEALVDMSEVRWNIGETIYLQVADNSTQRYSVKLIGFVKDQTLLFTAPTIDGKFELIRAGQSFIARAFLGKKAYAFIASVVKYVHSPYPYMHLTYPKNVRCNVVRQGARTDVNIIAALSMDVSEQVYAGVMVDLSVKGASVVIKERVGKIGDQGRIKFKVQAVDQDEFLNLQTTLRSVTAVENGTGFRHGFEFIDPSARDRLVLSAFVHQKLAEEI